MMAPTKQPLNTITIDAAGNKFTRRRPLGPWPSGDLPPWAHNRNVVNLQ